MTILRIEDSGAAVHAEFSSPGMWSKVFTLPIHGVTIAYHVVQDELSPALDKHYECGDFQVKQNQFGPYLSYAARSESHLHGFLRNHRSLVDMWTDLYRTEGDTLINAVTNAMINRDAEPVRSYKGSNHG